MTARQFLEKLEAEYASCGEHVISRSLDDGTYVMAKPLLFHWTVIRGVIGDSLGYFDRWCFETRELALAALNDFPLDPPSDYDPPGWHRHPKSGRRRPNGDKSLEYIDP